MVRVRFWWWGEDEAPGLASWVARTAQEHELRANVRVETRLLRHDQVIQSLPASALEGDTADLHFLWNGIYHIEHAWSGLLSPLDDYLPARTVATISGGPQSRYRSRTYRAAWYLIPVVWIVNRDLLARVGVDTAPRVWDELVDVCERLHEAGIPPIVAGDAEGDVSVWWLTHLLTQAFDRGTDIAHLALGERSWQEPRYARAWHELRRFVERGWLDRSCLPLTLWDAFARFGEGGGAFTLASAPMFVDCRRRLGDRVEMMTAPCLEDGALARLPIIDSQGIGIPSHAKVPDAGAALLETLLGQAAADRLYDRLGLLPARPDWNSPMDDEDRNARSLRDRHLAGESAPYVPNLLPLSLHFDLCAAVGQAVIAGKLEAVAAGREADARCAGWRSSNAEQQALYAEWIDGVRADEEGDTR